jgi:galactokinase
LEAADASGWAPGRVNLVGEHTDYNGGFVLPVALTLGVRVEIEPADELRLESPAADAGSIPLAYAVCRALNVPERLAIRVEATLPAGAGLGSSAAFEVALARALRELHGLGLENRELALACHRAENELVRCGVMDQLASALARPGAALLIDCASLELRNVDLPDTIEFAVLDSGGRHANADSGYERRRAECEQAARALGVELLREVGSAEDLAKLPEPLRRRALHVFQENERALAAVAALKAGAADALAELMRASHRSQRDLFEVSTPEVNALVERAEAAGALAARLTGGGFGGAVVALCRRGEAQTVAETAGAPLLAVVAPG